MIRRDRGPSCLTDRMWTDLPFLSHSNQILFDKVRCGLAPGMDCKAIDDGDRGSPEGRMGLGRGEEPDRAWSLTYRRPGTVIHGLGPSPSWVSVVSGTRE